MNKTNFSLFVIVYFDPFSILSSLFFIHTNEQEGYALYGIFNSRLRDFSVSTPRL